MIPRLAFVIPAHNAGETLADTVSSLQAQGERAWEAVIVDDRSSDGTRGVAAALAARDGRVRAVASRGGAGVSAARNAGLALVRAPHVTFLDADDVVAPAFGARMLEAVRGADLASAGYEYLGARLEPSGWRVAPTDEDRALTRLAELNPFCTGATVFERRALLEHAGPAPFPEGSHHEDWELLLRLTAHGARWAPVVPEPLFGYRLRDGTRTGALGSTWSDGRRIVAGWSSPPVRTGAVRRWDVRMLARAAVAGDDALARTIREALGPLAAPDEGVLRGALDWSVRRARVIRGGGCAGPAGDALVDRLGGGVVAARAAAGVGADAGPWWRHAAMRAADAVLPGQVLVLYGMGRNGRELLRELRLVRRRRAHDLRLAYIDDGDVRIDGLERLTPDDLGPGHVVVVTAFEREAIVRRLAGRPLAGVRTLDDLGPVRAA